MVHWRGLKSIISLMNEKGIIEEILEWLNLGSLLIDGGLIDSPLKGAKDTWSNFRDIPSLSCLDRFLYCNDWDDLFPG